ncbi:expressed unknown protein [Seminavis robusta]|uniref:Uncharacterized protein n=1 Tax=Seminavis robusta TaxID=568900 RepID=A0A9N8EHF1_9STRA|nr:expressed unknown protein [Seminavis robusta]|eukprot:Sro1009_g230680.1 n/a (107) ;mRNA; f:11278-11598
MEIPANPESNDWLWIYGDLVTGIGQGKWARTQMEGCMVRYKQSSPGIREVNIYLEGSKEKMQFKSFKSFVRVDVDWLDSENYHGSSGLLGSYDHNGARLVEMAKLS